MRTDFLASLHCPYSGSPLSLSAVLEQDGEQIDYGIVGSEAGDFPIVDGILRLQLDEYRIAIVKHVREKRLSEALTIALGDALFRGHGGAAIIFASRLAFRSGFNGAGERLHRLKSSLAHVVTRDDATFVEIVEKLNPGRAADWQIFRFSMPTFLPVFALSHIVRDESAILDFGSGSGQAAFLMSRMWPNANIVCADYSFCSLYLAKKYFVPDASHVCLDGNYLLPFESGQFSTVFSTDTLHCIDSKLSIAQEFRRVGCDKAVMILPHLHNRLASPYAKSLTPRGYRRLFQGMEIRIIPEQEVIRDYFSNDSLDLRSERDDEQLAASKQGLSIVGSADSAVFRRIDALWDRRVAGCRHPRINPAYQISGGPGNWELTRRVNEPYATTFTEFDEICLPGTYRVSAPSLDARGLLNLRQTDARQFARLARSLLVLDLPEGFISEHPVLQHGNGRRTIRAAL